MAERDGLLDGETFDLLIAHLEGMSRHLSGVVAPEVQEAWNRDVRQLVDILFVELDARIQQRVEPWALTGNDALVPVEKLDKDAILSLIAKTEMFTIEELAWALSQRIKLSPAA
ncbi:MAG: hypothetical protein OXG81_10220 [Acidobacteria bacterium]|nr:hypothetical protein [Acidobacteriota bacterium]